jgi:putative ATPase
LADRIRPRRLEDLVGQDHLIGPGTVLGKALRSGNLFSLILWGPPGSGKTTLAKLIAQYTQNPFQSFSAVTSGMKELREVVAGAEKVYRLTGKATIFFVDEIHRFNKAQQDGFLPHVESGLIVLVGATTENPSFEIIPPLLSRTRVLVLRPLEKDDLRTILTRALSDKESGLGELEIEMTPRAMEHLIDLSSGDARIALNNLEMAVNYVSPNQEGKRILDLEEIEKALSRKALPYDKDGEEHYNIISAFHKSLRGGDAQASLYWLYRMLMAGEDPLFICRRMIRFASEDIGLADARALHVALAAFEAWEKVGPPEAELALAEAAVYLASAPKSNASILQKSRRQRSNPQSPARALKRNAPMKLMKNWVI